jgi:ubiquinone/menaquinone biosynthesis C-methylase UbiE
MITLNAEMEQRGVDRYFDANASHWDEIYRKRDLDALVYQSRQAVALKLIDHLQLPPGSRILEIGCGAGTLTLSLARRGYFVRAVDRVGALLELIDRRAAQLGYDKRIATSIGDAHRLYFADNSFDLVVALGVIPWLHTPSEAVWEIARVLRPGGYAVVTADNRWRLTNFFDPRRNPVLAPVRRTVKKALETARLRHPSLPPRLPHLHSIGEIDGLLRGRGVGKIIGFTIGFGPFTFMGRRVLPDSVGTFIHRALQRLADEQMPGIRSAGAHYTVLAQKEDASGERAEPEYALRQSNDSTTMDQERRN